MQKLPSVFIFCGLLTLVASILLGWIAGPLIVQDQIIRNAKIENGSFIWHKWKNPTNEMFLKVYLFNVTNPAEVANGGVPVLQELGPYHYEERRVKRNISYNPDKDSYTYTQPVTYIFREELSSGSENDILTVVNLPLVGVSHRLHTYSSWVKYLLGMFMGQYEEDLFIQKTVAEMVFQGYHSPMVEELQGLTGENTFPNATVGLLVGRNASDYGVLEVHSGITDYSKLGQYVSFNGKSHMTQWPAEPCNMINGTDGSVLPPFLSRRSVIRGFNPDFCRSISLQFTKEMSFRDVPGLRFEAGSRQFLHPRENPSNTCFCLDANEELSNCFEDGVFSGSGCHRDGPITISLPHFLYAPHYQNLTHGLKPDKQKHGIVMEVEPMSGLILRATQRMQINVDLRRNRALVQMKHVPTMQLPVMWVEETMLLDQEMKDVLLSQLLIANTVLEISRWLFLVISFVLLAVAVTVTMMRARKKPYMYGS